MTNKNDKQIPDWNEQDKCMQASFWGYLGCEYVHADEQGATIRLKVQPHHLNTIGIVHGGVLSSLLDNAMGIAACIYKQEPHVVTGNLNVNFVQPMKGGILKVHAHVVHATRRLLTLQGSVSNEHGELGTIATGTFHVVTVQKSDKGVNLST